MAPDIPLFDGIISDLFPGVERPIIDYQDLMNILIERLKSLKLQPVPWFLEKIIQIYEMILVRHGLMIVGQNLSGKTW